MLFDKENSPDLGVGYNDCGPYDAEIGELYSYSEYKDFNMVFMEFSLFLEEKDVQAWTILSDECKTDLINDLLCRLSYSDGKKRQKALCCLVYLAQGCWAELDSCQLEKAKSAVQSWLRNEGKNKEPPNDLHYKATKSNIILLYSHGLLGCLIQLLNLEASLSPKKVDLTNEVTMNDTVNLRLCLNLLYTLLETIRTLKKSDNPEEKKLYEDFRQELSAPMIDDELLLVKLFNLLVDGSNGLNERLPLKKILLCVWKTILISFGDFETLENLRIQYREEAGLERHFEHTLQVLREKVPALKVPLPENQNNLGGDQRDMWESGEGKPRRSLLRPSLLKVQTITSTSYEDDIKSPEAALPSAAKTITSLPWQPKMDERELHAYVRGLRLKYFGLDLPYSDVDTLFGLPDSVQEGIKILKQNLYTSLSDVQLRQEERLHRHFMSAPPSAADSSVETFYEYAWRDLRQYVITLLKLMLASTPLSVEKDKYLNIDAEIDAKIAYGALNHMLAETIASDMKRHKDIVVKTISSVVLLLLKHYKLNHVLQFEYLGSCLMNGNCLPFIIKYFNQNLDTLVMNTQTAAEAELEYPRCVRASAMSCGSVSVKDEENQSNDGSQNNGRDASSASHPRSTFPSFPVTSSFSSTNISTCINLLRILNKLVKNKQSRILALIYFKSFAPLKSALRVRHNVLQLYALKLIKLQSRYQGRQWRKVNIKILGYVFLMVRHRFHDDWAYGNELESKQHLDSQADEAALKRIVLRFNKRRYASEPELDFVPVDSSVSGALGEGEREGLSEEFKRYWPQWLEQKVLGSDFDWDQLLNCEALM